MSKIAVVFPSSLGNFFAVRLDFTFTACLPIVSTTTTTTMSRSFLLAAGIGSSCLSSSLVASQPPASYQTLRFEIPNTHDGGDASELQREDNSLVRSFSVSDRVAMSNQSAGITLGKHNFAMYAAVPSEKNQSEAHVLGYVAYYFITDQPTCCKATLDLQVGSLVVCPVSLPFTLRLTGLPFLPLRLSTRPSKAGTSFPKWTRRGQR